MSTAQDILHDPASDLSLGRHDSHTGLRLVPELPRRTVEVRTVSGAVTRGFARREWQGRLTLACADVVAALSAALLVLGGLSAGWLWLCLAGIVIFGSNTCGLYDREALLIRQTTLEEAPRLLHLATKYVFVVWLLEDVVGGHTIAPIDGLFLLGATLTLTLILRSTARAGLHQATGPERCMFIGDPAAAARLGTKLAESHSAELVAQMSLRDACAALDRDRGDAVALNDAATRDGVRRIIVGQSDDDPQAFDDVLRGAKRLSPRVSVLANLPDVLVQPMIAENIGGLTMFGARRYGLSRMSETLKRLADIAGATLLLVACAPLMALIAVLVKADSAGPVFFRQTRVGRHGEHFAILKFRTMGVDAEDRKDSLRDRNEATDGLFKIADDPRVTRSGRLLRASSLDELPQLINVLRGKMSLVGPRPLVCDEDERITGFDRHRLHVKPGMTGVWQIAGSSRVPVAEMVKMDYRYIAGWTAWSDTKIVLRTLSYVLARRGM